MELSSSAKLQFLIGDIGYAFTNEFGIFYDVKTLKNNVRIKHD
jgi:hypothetical protein